MTNTSPVDSFQGLNHLFGYGNYQIANQAALRYSNAYPHDTKFIKAFYRWNHFWKSRCGSDGSTKTYVQKLINAANEPAPICNSGNTWSNIGAGRIFAGSTEIQNQGFITSVYTHPSNPNIIFAGAQSGGIWKTIDNGQNWRCVTDHLRFPGLGISSIVGHPINTNILYATTGYSSLFGQHFGIGILKSTDGGETWSTTSVSWSAEWGGILTKLVMHPTNPNIMYAVGQKAVFKTTDGWNTKENLAVIGANAALFQSVDPYYNIVDAALLPSDPETVIVCTSRAFPKTAKVYAFKQVGNIRQWADITPANTYTDRYNIAVTKATGHNHKIHLIFRSYESAYPSINSPSTTEIRITDDIGTNWPSTSSHKIVHTVTFATYLKFEFVPFKISNTNPNIWYLGTAHLLVSRDGGHTFSNISGGDPQLHADTRDIQIYEESSNGLSDKLIAGTDGGVSKSLEGGINWQNINGTTLRVGQFFDIGISSLKANMIIGGAQDCGTMIKSGSDWLHVSGGDGGVAAVDWSDPNYVYARANSGFDVSTNGGNTFVGGVGIGGNEFTPFALRQDPNDPQKLLIIKNESGAGTFKNMLYRLDNRGRTITSSYNFNSGGVTDILEDIRDIQIAPSDSKIIYMGGIIKSTLVAADPNQRKGCLFKSVNNGDTWQLIGQPYFGINCIVIDPNNPNKIWTGHDWHGGNGRVQEWNIGLTSSSMRDITTSALPFFAINSLVYQRGTNGVLYAGTDAGVFRYNPNQTNPQWECFNQNLPPCIVSDLEIDYCKGKLYAATYGRGLWISDLAATPEQIITQNTILESGSVTNAVNDIIIRSGKRLIVKGRLNMAATKKIVVEIGAELVVEGGTISNYCGDMWQGIVVKGNVNADLAGFFPNRNQGYVNFYNANIENARTAVASESGGMITAFGTNFTNNVRDVSFIYYPFPQRSSFTRCNFKLNDQYRSRGIDARMSMWAVKGVSISGCSFENNTNNANFDIFNPNVKGIYAIDAEFSVGAYCSAAVPYPLDCPAPNLVRSNFSKFRYAVRALMTNGNPTYWIDRTDFTDNQTGIYSQQVNNMTITRNTFNIDNKSTTEWHYGIVMETGTGFKLEENTFNGNNQPANTNYSVGLVIINLGSQDNVSYRNTYTKLRLGNIAEGFNNADNMLDYYGFQYLCNEQNNNDYDIFVASPPGIRHFQGKEIDPRNPNQLPLSAQNTFSNNGGNREIDNYGRSIIYLADNAVPRSIPQSVRPGWVAVNTDQVVSPGCPSKLPIFKQKMSRSEKDVVQAAFELQHSLFEDAKYLHRMILNGGNTTDLKNEIQMASETWQLRNKLLLNSPNLTTDVLIEVARRGILTRAMLMEVFFANIKACQDKEFLDIIQNDIPNPISEEMADLLIGVQEPESLRKVLETQIAKYNTARTELGNQIITDILTADIVIADSLRYWLAKMDSPESQYAIAESFMSEGRYAEAISAAQQVPILYGEYKQSVEEHDDYMTIFNLKQNVFHSNRQLNELNSSELVTLRNIATSNKGSAKTLAWNLITLNTGEAKDYKFRFPADIDKRRKTAKPQLALSQQLTNVKVYPSPANEYVIFEYNLPEEIKEATIFVTDLSGKVISELATKNYRGILNWDTRMIAQGVYVYKMIYQGHVLSIGKLTIIK